MSWSRTTIPVAPGSPESTATNPARQCCEHGNLFSEKDIDAAIDRLDEESDESDESGESGESDESEGDGDVVSLGAMTAIHRHSEQVFVCSNADAHQNEPHYICTSCASLANIYLSNIPNELLEGGTPPMQGKRFFPLCSDCAIAANHSPANRGCVCDYRDQNLCFKCKLELLGKGAAKRDAEVNSRLGFIPAGNKESEVLFVTPVLKCICGNENIWTQDDGLQCTLRCAACEGIVPMISGRAWDPLARGYKVFPKTHLQS